MRSVILFTLGLCLIQLVEPSILVSKKAHLSAKRDGVGGIRVEELFYFAGGFELNDYIPTNIVEIYNITSGEWMEPIYLDEARGFISTAVIGQNIYFIGGTRVVTCATLYNTSIHQYEDIGCGPTVRKSPGQISVHNSTVTILGSFSVDFYNISSKQWYYLANLTAWMQNISGGMQAVHENMIIGVGGVNVVTLEQSYDAWIYDTYTNQMIVFSNATSISEMITFFKFSVANNRVVFWTPDRLLWHQFGTMKWQEISMADPYNAIILPDVLFAFNSTGFLVYNYSTELSTFTFSNHRAIYQFDSQIVLDFLISLQVYENGLWTQLQLTTHVDEAVRWGNKYVFHKADYPLRFYDPISRSVSWSSSMPSEVSSMTPFDEERLLIFTDSKMAYIYFATNDSLSELFNVSITNGVVIGTDVVSLTNQVVWANLTQVTSLETMLLAAQAPDYKVLFGLASDYKYIDIYNIESRKWQPKIFLNISQPLFNNFVPAMVIDDMLIVGRRYSVFRYNATSGEATAIFNSPTSMNIYSSVNRAPTVNHISYLPGMTSASTIIRVTASSVVSSDAQSVPERTVQFTTSPANVMYMATIKSSMFSKIFTYNISSGELETLVLPVIQTNAFIASVGNSAGYRYDFLGIDIDCI